MKSDNQKTEKIIDLDELLHPAQAFSHPQDVVLDPDLTLNEKRAILASWASDASAVEACPALRAPRPGVTVTFDDIMDALRGLDYEAQHATRQPHYRRVIERMRRRRSSGGEQGGPSPSAS
jgi:hypothetical protein